MIDFKKLCLRILLSCEEHTRLKQERQPTRNLDCRRLVLTHKSIKKTAGVSLAYESFFVSFRSQMLEYGWYSMDSGNGSEILIRTDAVANWLNIGILIRSDIPEILDAHAKLDGELSPEKEREILDILKVTIPTTV